MPKSPEIPADFFDAGLANKLVQNHPLTPVCRIHVYDAGLSAEDMAKGYLAACLPPKHWAGSPEERARNGRESWNTPPAAVLGRNACTIQGGKATPIDWHVLSCRVNLTRQWNCSSASFQLAHPEAEGEPIHLPPIRPNDIIVIELGYTYAPVVNVALPNGQTNYSVFTGDVVFMGAVDTLKLRGGSGDQDGIVWTVQARDMMRFLADNKLRANYLPTISDEPNRAVIVRDLLYMGAAVDTVKWKPGFEKRGVKLKPGATNEFLIREPVIKETKLVNGKQMNVLESAKFGPKNSYLELGRIELSSRVDAIKPANGADPDGIRLMDKFPLDVIKHFSQVESAPRELWADQRTGQIHWMARRTDGRRLYSADPKVSAERQYFYRYPKERANIISFTNEWSTVGTITHFCLTNPISQAGEVNASADLYAESPMAFLKDPHTDKPLRMMTRNRFVYDDTMQEGDRPESVVGALFHIFGRSLETGMAMVLGDPTLEIGEAVQLFNTGLFGRRAYGPQDIALDASKEYYADKGTNPDGIQRVETVQHLFAVGGPQRGYVTAFVWGPPDDDTGAIFVSEQTPDPANAKPEDQERTRIFAQRFFTTDAQFNEIVEKLCLGRAELDREF